jgi:hypothetical protein
MITRYFDYIVVGLLVLLVLIAGGQAYMIFDMWRRMVVE